MTTTFPGATEGHHAAATRLNEAIQEAVLATMSLDDLPDHALDDVTGGAGEHHVYWASAAFLSDLRADRHSA